MTFKDIEWILNDSEICACSWQNAAGERVIASLEHECVIAAHSVIESIRDSVQEVWISFVNSDYMELADLWVDQIERLGVRNFTIFATDPVVYRQLSHKGISCVLLDIGHTTEVIGAYRNKNGFEPGGLAILVARMIIYRELVRSGVNVVSCDLDAIPLKDFRTNTLGSAFMAFQRVVYFPKAIVDKWSFALCGGFVVFKACEASLKVIGEALRFMVRFADDQVALNLALLSLDVTWPLAALDGQSREKRVKVFIERAALPIVGEIPGLGAVIALPATEFWRHDFVPFDGWNCTILHPNSPKSADRKLEILKGLIHSIVNH